MGLSLLRELPFREGGGGGTRVEGEWSVGYLRVANVSTKALNKETGDIQCMGMLWIELYSALEIVWHVMGLEMRALN